MESCEPCPHWGPGCDPWPCGSGKWNTEPLLVRSPSSNEQRRQRLVEENTSLLNRGLGGFVLPSQRRRRQEAIWTPWVIVPLAAGAVVSLPALLVIECRFLSALGGARSLFTEDNSSFTYGLTSMATTPLACAGVNFIVEHIRETIFFWEHTGKANKAKKSDHFIDPLAVWPMVLTVLLICHGASGRLFCQTLAVRVTHFLECVIALICLRLYFAVLDILNAGLNNMAQEQELLNEFQNVKKMQNLVMNITHTGVQDKDAVYAFKDSTTVPAHVLAYIWWLYYIAGKVFGSAITLAFFLSVDRNTLMHAIFSGLLVSAAAATGFIFELGPNTMSLLRLALNKPFYVGDLVTLNENGSTASPASIMGFVENITMKYVIVRNFQMKQTWIPHKSFSTMIIQNWTRRPSKTVLLNIGISCRCPVKKVQKLKDFGFKWIEASPEIQQKNYRKCHITKMANGYNIEVIFYPEIGVSHRGIRQKFLVAFMSAAERMQIPFVPLKMGMNFCDETTTAPVPPDPGSIPEEPDEDEVCLDDLLPDPSDKLPKGAGGGFKDKSVFAGRDKR